MAKPWATSHVSTVASGLGIDASPQNIETATAHAQRSGVIIEYRATTPEEFAGSGQTFDVVVALEVVEHVHDVNLFLEACSIMTDREGTIILATLNRTQNRMRQSRSE